MHQLLHDKILTKNRTSLDYDNLLRQISFISHLNFLELLLFTNVNITFNRKVQIVQITIFINTDHNYSPAFLYC